MYTINIEDTSSHVAAEYYEVVSTERRIGRATPNVGFIKILYSGAGVVPSVFLIWASVIYMPP
jgi:hypothetical protein